MRQKYNIFCNKKLFLDFYFNYLLSWTYLLKISFPFFERFIKKLMK